MSRWWCSCLLPTALSLSCAVPVGQAPGRKDHPEPIAPIAQAGGAQAGEESGGARSDGPAAGGGKSDGPAAGGGKESADSAPRGNPAAPAPAAAPVEAIAPQDDGTGTDRWLPRFRKVAWGQDANELEELLRDVDSPRDDDTSLDARERALLHAFARYVVNCVDNLPSLDERLDDTVRAMSLIAIDERLGHVFGGRYRSFGIRFPKETAEVFEAPDRKELAVALVEGGRASGEARCLLVFESIFLEFGHYRRAQQTLHERAKRDPVVQRWYVLAGEIISPPPTDYEIAPDTGGTRR